MEQTECSETSAYKIQTPGNYPKESIQHTEHGESLKLSLLHVGTCSKSLASQVLLTGSKEMEITGSNTVTLSEGVT